MFEITVRGMLQATRTAARRRGAGQHIVDLYVNCNEQTHVVSQR